MNYAWKNRQYGEWELFPSEYLERECRHYWLGRHEKTNRTSIQADNIIERHRKSIPSIKENVFYTMTNKMSAAGRLGAHKYENLVIIRNIFQFAGNLFLRTKTETDLKRDRTFIEIVYFCRCFKHSFSN